MKTDMESLIHHFKLVYRRGSTSPPAKSYCAVEPPQKKKGEFGRLPFGGWIEQTLPCQTARAGFCKNLQAMDYIAKGHQPGGCRGGSSAPDIVFGEGSTV